MLRVRVSPWATFFFCAVGSDCGDIVDVKVDANRDGDFVFCVVTGKRGIM